MVLQLLYLSRFRHWFLNSEHTVYVSTQYVVHSTQSLYSAQYTAYTELAIQQATNMPDDSPPENDTPLRKKNPL